MEVGRLYLDSNILIELGEGTGEITRLLADLFSLKAAPSILITSELTVGEILVHPYRHKSERLTDQYEGWLQHGVFLSAIPVTLPVLRAAAHLRADIRSLKLPDAIHYATATIAGCSHFVTGDRRLHGLQAQPSTRESLDQWPDVIGPTPEFLQEVIRRQQ